MKTLQDCKNEACNFLFGLTFDEYQSLLLSGKSTDTEHNITIVQIADRYAQSRVSELERENELLNVRDAKRQKKFERLNKENGGLYAEKERLEKEVETLRAKTKNGWML